MGRETGCRELARAFYARVANEPVLKPLFPGKSLRCATEEFAAFLIQFFDGDEDHMQYRWWLSLRESHSRFSITDAQRRAWLACMSATIESSIADPDLRADLEEFFGMAASYIVDAAEQEPRQQEFKDRWDRQLSLDRLVDDIVKGRDTEAIALARLHVSRRSVFAGILGRMMQAGRPTLIEFVLTSIEQDSSLGNARFNGRTLLHFAAGCGCLPAVRRLLAVGVDPNVLDSGGHAPLYRVANGSGASVGGQVVRELVRAGADVNHGGGVTRSTALHAAARQGHLKVAKALLDLGASVEIRDKKGFTPLDRAVNCRKSVVADLLRSRL